MTHMGLRTLSIPRRRGHPRGMDLRRRAATAALVLALLVLGLRLASYRPRLVPELKPGPRVAAVPPSYGEENSREWAPASGGDGAGLSAAPPEDISAGELADVSLFDAPQLRDAPADAGLSAGARAPTSGVFDAARRQSEWRQALDAAARKKPRGADAPPAATVAAVAAVARTATKAPVAVAARRPFSARPFGTPMFTGPAPSEENHRVEREAMAGAPGPAGARPAGRRSGFLRRDARGFPLFRPPRRAVVRPRAPSARRVRPLLLSKLLGRGALRPPPGSIVPPDLSRLDARKPPVAPATFATPADVEARDPRKLGPACRKRGGHWDGALWHDGAARGSAADGRWLWLWKAGSRWWARGAAEEPPFLRHQNLWWSKQKGVWFALHEGELWSWRRFSRWDAEGLIRLTDGVEIVYSADFKMAAVITPGAGAVLYDAATGAELGSWLESEMPRRRPRAPERLRLPSGI